MPHIVKIVIFTAIFAVSQGRECFDYGGCFECVANRPERCYWALDEHPAFKGERCVSRQDLIDNTAGDFISRTAFDKRTCIQNFQFVMFPGKLSEKVNPRPVWTTTTFPPPTTPRLPPIQAVEIHFAPEHKHPIPEETYLQLYPEKASQPTTTPAFIQLTPFSTTTTRQPSTTTTTISSSTTTPSTTTLSTTTTITTTPFSTSSSTQIAPATTTDEPLMPETDSDVAPAASTSTEVTSTPVATSSMQLTSTMMTTTEIPDSTIPLEGNNSTPKEISGRVISINVTGKGDQVLLDLQIELDIGSIKAKSEIQQSFVAKAGSLLHDAYIFVGALTFVAIIMIIVMFCMNKRGQLEIIASP